LIGLGKGTRAARGVLSTYGPTSACASKTIRIGGGKKVLNYVIVSMVSLFLFYLFIYFFTHWKCNLFFSPFFFRLQEDPPTGVSGAPTDNNIMIWNAVIFG